MSTHSLVNVMSLILSTPEPNPPANVTITQATCNSVTVNWAPPTHNGNAEITGYRVIVYRDSDHVLRTETDTAAMDLTYKFSSLDPDTDYTVEVKAMNVGGVGNGTGTNFTTNKKGLLCSGLCTLHKYVVMHYKVREMWMHIILYSMYRTYHVLHTYHTLSMPRIHQTMNTTWCSMRALYSAMTL